MPALRSLVMCLIHPEVPREVGSHERAVALAGRFPAGWERRPEDDDAIPALVRSLRERSPEDAQETLARAIGDGLGAETAWNALRLFGTDTFLRRAPAARRRHLPVHTVTELNAFDTSRRRASDPAVRAVSLLQAAGWLVELRRACEEQSGPIDDGEGVLAEGRPARSVPSPGLLRVATQDHHLKYAAAAREEAARAPARYRSRLLSAGADYLPAPGGETAPRAAEAIGVLERGGRG